MAERGRTHDLLAVAAMLIAMVAFQAGASLAKQLFASVGAQGTVTLRLAFGALILLGVWRPWRSPLPVGAAWPIFGYGAALAGVTFFFYMAIRTIPLGVAVALQFTGPLAVATLSSRRAIDFLWIGLATLGVGLLLPIDGLSSPLDTGGVAFALAAAVGWGLYIILGRKAGAAGQGRAVTLGMVIAALIVAPFGVAHAGARLADPAILPLALAVAVLTSALPISLEMFALVRLPGAIYGVLSSLEPAIGAIAGLLLLHERLAPLQMIAMGAIMAASAGAVITHPRDPASLAVD